MRVVIKRSTVNVMRSLCYLCGYITLHDNTARRTCVSADACTHIHTYPHTPFSNTHRHECTHAHNAICVSSGDLITANTDYDMAVLTKT